MKKCYFLIAILCAFATASHAQAIIPRPIAPGVEFSIQKNTASQIGALNKDANHLSAPKFKTAPQAPRLMEATADITTKDTLLVTGHVIKRMSDEEQRKNETITYDKYGRRAMLTTFNTNGEIASERRYAYEVGPFNFWTKKLVQEKSAGSSEWKDCEKEEREIDENGNLTHKKSYVLKKKEHFDEAMGDWISDNKMILVSDAYYDYNHSYKNGNGVETKGALVEIYVYNDNGQLETHLKYQWAECAKQYILISSSYDDEQNIIGDDHITQIQYRKNDNGDLVKSYERISYYENGEYMGYKEISYDTDGTTITYVTGHKSTQETNIPSEGWITRTDYEYDEKSDTFVASSKREEKGMRIDDKGTNYSLNVYEYDNGTWSLTQSYKSEILDGKIYKISYTVNSYSQILYQKLDENDSIIGTVTFDDDNSYKVTTRELYNEEYHTNYVDIYYYDAVHNLLKAIRCIKGYKNNLPQDNYVASEDTNTYYELKDGKWVLTKEYEVKDSGYQGYNIRTVYTFTDDGYPSAITEYMQKNNINGGKEFVNSKTIYIYSNNGYKEEEYSVWSAKDLTLQMDEYHSYYILEDGSLETTYVEYDDEKKPGTIYSGSRYITKEDGSSWTYKYNKKTTSWVLTDTYIPDFQEYVYKTEDDGTYVTIQRKQGDNGEVINVAKTERLQKESEDRRDKIDNYAEYQWDENTSSWIGINKYEKEEVNLDFGYEGIDPTTQYDDEYLPHDVRSPYGKTYWLYRQKYYRWDKSTNKWAQYQNENEETKDMSYKIEGNKLSYTSTVQNDHSILTTIGEILLNDDNFITSDSNISQHTNLENNMTSESKDITTYQYNRYGKLEEKNHEYFYENGKLSYSESEKFIYEEAKILPTLIDKLPLSNANKNIQIDGLKISCDSQNGILLYNAEGRLSAKGTHFVVAPKSGIYILKVAGETMKILLK